MTIEQDEKGAAVKFPPPLVFVIGLLISYGVNTVYNWPIIEFDGLVLVGAAIAIVGLIIIVIANLSFKKAQTNIEPWKPTSNIVSSGIFSYSRNPIYIAFVIITIGVALMLNSVWVLLSAVPSLFIVYNIAIKKEEAYLIEKFGEEYITYQQSVRRWL